jgi:uncharacterized heparinase superfamily protein
VNSAYVRLNCGTMQLICDLGPAPAASLSYNAQAGFLSFEIASGDAPMIVNCGTPSLDHQEWLPYARSTAAQSTLTFEDSSSGEFSAGVDGTPSVIGSPLIGPSSAQATLADQGDNLRIKGAHEGYLSRFGVVHARQILIAQTGKLISGEDKLTAPKGLSSPEGLIAGAYAIRFHLHPSVNAALAADGRSVNLLLKNGETWRISSNAPETAIEESFFLADARGPQRTSQVVLGGVMGEAYEVRVVWNIEQVGANGDAHPLVDPNDAPPTAA